MTAAPPPAHDRLARRLGLRDAVAIGLAAMIGAGVFAVWAPAAQAAGAWLLAGLAIAAFVAFANAGSTAQLAVRYPEAGGAYRYGRERLGPWPGFLAGWGFVIGKTASCAAMAITAAAYLVPAPWQRPVAVAAVVVLVGVNVLGVTRTARVATVIVLAVVAVLAVVVAAGIVAWAGPEAASVGLIATDAAGGASALGGAYGVLQSAALVFFAFAGYARIATLGEEVRDPSRTIPRAIAIAFGIVVVVYAAVGTAALGALGPERLAASVAPLVDVVGAAGWTWAEPVVRAAAGVAALGALLALIAGVGRTGLAMARDGELPAGARPGASAVRGTARRRAHGGRGGRRARAPRRPARRDRVLVVRRAALLPRRERVRAHAAARGTARAALALVGRCDRMRRARRHLPPVSIVAGVAVLVVGLLVRAARLAVARRRSSRP